MLNGIGDTLANLKEAFGGEDYEVKSMYPEFAQVAEEEGETAAPIAFDNQHNGRRLVCHWKNWKSG